MTRRVKVAMFQTARPIEIDADATEGAVFGRDLVWPDGTVVRIEDLIPEPGDDPVVYWRTIQEIPPNVVALAETSTDGIYVITGDGTSATRTIETEDLITIDNPSGVGGNPRIGKTVLKHVESSPESTWTINHNLGRDVEVAAFTPGGARVIAEVLLVSLNQAQVIFDSPMSGFAIIN